jgi:hypothetical protein
MRREFKLFQGKWTVQPIYQSIVCPYQKGSQKT